MSERFKEPVLKTGDGATHRGFESHSLRQQKSAPIRGRFFVNEEAGFKRATQAQPGEKLSGGIFGKLGIHRQELATRDFSSGQGLKNGGILNVFPIFQAAVREEKIRCPAAVDGF